MKAHSIHAGLQTPGGRFLFAAAGEIYAEADRASGDERWGLLRAGAIVTRAMLRVEEDARKPRKAGRVARSASGRLDRDIWGNPIGISGDPSGSSE